MTGGSSSGRKGSRRERQFANFMSQLGFSVVRVASSGSGTKDDRPDVLAWDGRLYVVEVKARKKAYCLLSDEEIEVLWRLTAESEIAEPRVAFKPDYRDWVWFHPGDLNATAKGYSITRAMYDEATPLKEELGVPAHV